MQIREIHIERFGKFTNFRLMNISGGLNVIYGRNEFGKTTLLEFVRWVLFGFETRRKGINTYDPIEGGVHAGTLVCEMYNGEKIFISRKGGTREGQVTIRTADWEGTGQQNLETFIGHASRKIFKNIYAFALDELQDLDSLMEDEIKNKILGAGMGLGKVSLADVEDEIRDRQDKLFLPRGMKPAMNQGYREIKGLEENLRSRFSEVDRYDDLNKKIWVLEKSCASRESNIDKLETRRRTLELKRELFSDFIDLENKTVRRTEIASIPEMDEDSLAAFEKIQTKMEDLIPRLEEEQAKLRQLKLKRDPMVFNPNLLERETEILQLRQLTELVKTAQADKHAVYQERDLLNEKIRSTVEGVRKGWDEERMLALEWTDADKQFLARQEQALSRSEKFLENVINRLELHQEQQVNESLRQKNVPGAVRTFTWLLIAVGFAGAGYALFSNNVDLGIFMGLVLAAGVGLSIWLAINRPEDSQDEEPLENLLKGKVSKAEMDMNAEIKTWSQWVEAKGLDPETSPTRYRELQTLVGQVSEWALQRAALNDRLSRMQAKETEAEDLVAALCECAPEIILSAELGINIEMVCRHFEQSREQFTQARDLDAQIRDQKERMEGIAEQLQRQRESILQLLQSAQVDSEESFLRQWYLAEEKKTLNQSIQQIQARIQKRVGLGEAYQAFLDSMVETYPDQLDQELTEVHARLSELHEQQDRSNQEIGKYRGESAQLASREDLVQIQNELEARKEQLMNNAREWATLTLALDMLEQAKVQYEKNRQPHVFQAAGRMFSKITEGNYHGVEKPLDSDDFRIVQRGGGGFIPPSQLSRGTREQLYLSMRFGLIEDYETRAEPLPLMMDDVFVNFDDARREHVLDILQDFARERQVIILSCHEHLQDTYLKYGAKQVNFQEN